MRESELSDAQDSSGAGVLLLLRNYILGLTGFGLAVSDRGGNCHSFVELIRGKLFR
jgi:hypothetical protein